MTIGYADIFGIVKFSSACSTHFARFDKHSEKCNTVKRKFVPNKRPQAKRIVNPAVSVCLSYFRHRFRILSLQKQAIKEKNRTREGRKGGNNEKYLRAILRVMLATVKKLG